MTLTPDAVRTDATALIERIRLLRERLAVNGADADRDNVDPTANFDLLREAGVGGLLVPVRFGGAFWDGGFTQGWGTYVRAATEVAVGDGPTGQNWLTTGLVMREIVGAELPESTKAEVSRRVRDEGLRLVASNAEAGSPKKVTARIVDGGIVVSGTKTFNSNSGGQGLANVGLVLDGPDGPGRHHALVDLTHPDVAQHHDWDVMGQRGTYSQSITYKDVFVPDGWHYAARMPPPAMFGAVMLLHASIMQGVGEGALHAAVDYVRTLKRGTLPQFATAAEDPLVLRRVGEMSSRLAASRALLISSADEIDTMSDRGDDPRVVNGYRAKVSCVQASLFAAQEVFELTGARSTSNKYRLDRFWRNSRTFASHDSIDAKNITVGAYEINEDLPSVDAFLRV